MDAGAAGVDIGDGKALEHGILLGTAAAAPPQ
jgi:hypothetical protein